MMRHRIAKFLFVSVLILPFVLFGVTSVALADGPNPTPETEVTPEISGEIEGDTIDSEIIGTDIVTSTLDSVPPEKEAESEAQYKFNVFKEILKLMGVPDLAVNFSFDTILEKAMSAFEGFLDRAIFPDFTDPENSFNRWGENLAIATLPVTLLAVIGFGSRLIQYRRSRKGEPPNVIVFLCSLLLFSIFLTASSLIFELFAVLGRKVVWWVVDITGESFQVSAYNFVTLVMDMSSGPIWGKVLLAVTGPLLGLALMGSFFMLTLQRVLAAPLMSASLVLEERPFGAFKAGSAIISQFVFHTVVWTGAYTVVLLAASGDIGGDTSVLLGLGFLFVLFFSTSITKVVTLNLNKKINAIEKAHAEKSLDSTPEDHGPEDTHDYFKDKRNY